jgi:hypothetical protein
MVILLGDKKYYKKQTMYPILELRPEFILETKGENIKKKRFVVPTVSIDISYPFPDKIIAIVKLIYSIDCRYEDEKTKVTASATNTYSITKNDNLDLLSNSDTVYYCAKMLERNLQTYLTERFLADQTLPDITLPSVSYYEWMNGKGNVIQFSAN